MISLKIVLSSQRNQFHIIDNFCKGKWVPSLQDHLEIRSERGLKEEAHG